MTLPDPPGEPLVSPEAATHIAHNAAHAFGNVCGHEHMP